MCLSYTAVKFLGHIVSITDVVVISILVFIATVKTNQKDGFHLDIEEYLNGILQMASELSRFATNAVTLGDHSRPLQISRFLADLNAGFRLLNLKNDSLRKRFDGLKYDVKKIEEIVYDLSIRGLIPQAGSNPAPVPTTD